MNPIAMYLGERTIHWSAIIITLGLLCCLSLTIALYRQRSEGLKAIAVYFPLATILSLLFARLIHWYFNTEIYGSLGAALTNFDLGSFSIPGVILGVWLGAWLVQRWELVPNAGMLLDCTAPGLTLLFAFVRLSALFNNTCRSRIEIHTPILKSLPFAVSTVDAAGNTLWQLAVFFIAFLVLLLLTGILLGFYVRKGKRKMLPACPRSGNVWRMFLLYYGAAEVVLDSLRNDSPLMHFHLISVLNQYSSFVSLAQVFAAFTILYVLVFYSVRSIRAHGFSWWHAVSWAVFVLCLVGVGFFGEYKVQRTAQYFKCYSIMILSCLVLVITIRLVYSSCVARKKYEW